MTGAEILIRCLSDAGVDRMSVLCGNGLNPILHEAGRAGMRLIDTRNEQSASYIADAYGRLTRRLGVCAVSSAVGHTNALIGVLNARYDGSPMLLISGMSNREHEGMGIFQELDQVALAAPITKLARLVDRAENIPSEVREAIGQAVSGRPGPVHLTLPLDVLEAQVPEDKVRWMRQPQALVRDTSTGDPDLVRDAVRLMAAAERPILVAGTGLSPFVGVPDDGAPDVGGNIVGDALWPGILRLDQRRHQRWLSDVMKGLVDRGEPEDMLVQRIAVAAEGAVNACVGPRLIVTDTLLPDRHLSAQAPSAQRGAFVGPKLLHLLLGDADVGEIA